ncbi:OsmC family protein [Agrobacterium rhizogenes]|uniref:OsmC family protein n=1 Tax=Rhizobium rhizogenes TaxID=359 RepID=UPI001573BC70|nr:OsmC family protein [Rhizobium rhizogenes]NTF52928.1 OsmC family protein [Rhizobium rhizogenes]NTH10138.1 OsmC family protein [Rhizobium rhizogenes]NTH42690.1 OsmC family protein [Rhizobium rhizogenes]NTI06697.1 OsmC family protein [Rhizobium rhizogenes]NTI13502.1 OsmC family protein [Rhizobium rhizogenes]
MSTLNEYLGQKREAVLLRRERLKRGELAPVTLTTSASAEGRSGVRRIRIRDFQVVSDSPLDFAGYNLGPSSPELLFGALSSCLTHTYLIHAADQGVSLESLQAEVSATIDPRGGSEGYENIPVYPHKIAYAVTLVSSASPDEIARVTAAVEKFCPILNLLRRGNDVIGRVDHQRPGEQEAQA